MGECVGCGAKGRKKFNIPLSLSDEQILQIIYQCVMTCDDQLTTQMEIEKQLDCDSYIVLDIMRTHYRVHSGNRYLDKSLICTNCFSSLHVPEVNGILQNSIRTAYIRLDRIHDKASEMIRLAFAKKACVKWQLM